MSRGRGDDALPTAAELRDMLRQRPALLEPGLRVLDGPLQLDAEVRASLVAEDAVGRPLLLLRGRGFGPDFYDRLLQLATRWRTAAGRLPVPFRRVDEPRWMLLVSALPEEAARRIELLRPSLPLRVRMLVPAAGGGLPRFLPVGEAPAPVDALSGGLGGEGRLALSRVLRACAAIRPAVRVEGDGWPLVLRGTDGPCVSLHEVDGKLCFATVSADGIDCRVLGGEESVDRAIDLLLRRQAGVIPAA